MTTLFAVSLLAGITGIGSASGLLADRPTCTSALHGFTFHANTVGDNLESVTYVCDETFTNTFEWEVLEESGITTATITSGQLLALNATPITVVAAPGAGSVLIFNAATLMWDYTSAACAGVAGAEDLVFRYTDGTGAIISGDIETTGFISAASDQVRHIRHGTEATPPVGDITQQANAPIVIHLKSGEVTTCAGSLKVRVQWSTVPATL